LRDKEMKDTHSYSFPSDFANALREIWDNLIAGQYVSPPRPSDLQLRAFLETIYLASMETDEARPLQFAVCATPESSDILQELETDPVEVWPFTTDREFNVQEIRRLAAATHLDSSGIWVCYPKNDDAKITIHGLVNFGSSWTYARRGYQYHHDQIPHAFLLRAEGPGRLAAYQGRYRVAALVAGEIVRPKGVSVFDLIGADPLFSEARSLLRHDVVPPQYEDASEWHEFEWTAVINVILSVVNTIQMNGHGGALIVASQSCELNDLLRIKYKLTDDTNDLRKRFVHFLNLRHKHGDMIWPAQFKENAQEVTKETQQLMMNEILEAQRRLTETCMFIGNLAGTDGAIVIGTDLKVKGFGAEILLDKAKPSKVYMVSDCLAGTREEGNSESFGMRHRSAIRLCGATTGLAVFVVSQDGGVSIVWNDKGDSCYKSGIQTTNANMVLA
jgi:hypothetical protein